LTIGVGFNLHRDDARARIAALGLDYDDVVSGRRLLTDAEIDRLLKDDIETAMAGAADLVSNFADLSLARQAVLVDMAFNLGARGLSRFRRFLAAVETGDWPAAEAEIVGSLYYRQVGERARRNARATLTGEFA
jgi:lysozyme